MLDEGLQVEAVGFQGERVVGGRVHRELEIQGALEWRWDVGCCHCFDSVVEAVPVPFCRWNVRVERLAQRRVVRGLRA
jgi:hypothetical protein